MTYSCHHYLGMLIVFSDFGTYRRYYFDEEEDDAPNWILTYSLGNGCVYSNSAINSGVTLSASHLWCCFSFLVCCYLQVISSSALTFWFNTVCKSYQQLVSFSGSTLSASHINWFYSLVQYCPRVISRSDVTLWLNTICKLSQLVLLLSGSTLSTSHIKQCYYSGLARSANHL